jgi:NADPH-dependent 2,4-dienoyl-CoA reductase/sulfur reductase-like enzyme
MVPPLFFRDRHDADAEMIGTRGNRREFLKAAAATASAAAFARPAFSQAAGPRVVVVGGGFSGATCARALRTADPRLVVTLVEPNTTFTATPLSNAVIAGLRDFKLQQFGYDKLAANGITLAFSAATSFDPPAKTLKLDNGTTLAYDRLVLAPGIDLRWNALHGYDQAAAAQIPHAWRDADQILLLRRQLDAMADGGTVVVSAPVNPARCPPAPYERACLIAHYLKTRKPRSKVILLDAKDTFSMQRLFQNAWKELYAGRLEWVPLSSGGNVTAVEVASKTLVTDFDRFKADVANVIPPQKAGRVTELAGVADRTGWCPIDPASFESKLQRNIHVIGDAAIAGAMPKSASAANAEAKLCAAALAKLFHGETPTAPVLLSTCYSLVAPDYAISITGTYRPVGDQYMEVEGAGGTSPLDAARSVRAREAAAAEGWFDAITREVYG